MYIVKYMQCYKVIYSDIYSTEGHEMASQDETPSESGTNQIYEFFWERVFK